jgi:transposase
MRWDDKKWKPKITRDEQERRRLAAAEDLLAGMNQRKVAKKYDVNPSSICRWNQMLREHGTEGLHRRKAPGNPCKLSHEQQDELRDILLTGAAAYGYPTDLWTLRRVAEVINEEFDIIYNFHSLGDVLHRMGFSPQKPKRRATERNEKAITTWLADHWSKAQKN